jgi:uncharacterized glyoxalase superfamily protein PhnB
MSDGYPTVTPMLSYEDIGRALDWLSQAFGFRERTRMTNEDGKIGHAEMEIGESGVIMLGTPGPDYRSPRHHAETCVEAQRWSQVPYVIDGLHVAIDDVDGHWQRARDAGAKILSDPRDEPYGERSYRVEDLEGHRWMFAQPLKTASARAEYEEAAAA